MYICIYIYICDHVLNTPSFFGDLIDGKEMPNALGDR